MGEMGETSAHVHMISSSWELSPVLYRWPTYHHHNSSPKYPWFIRPDFQVTQSATFEVSGAWPTKNVEIPDFMKTSLQIETECLYKLYQFKQI